MKRWNAAAKMANADTFINGLPNQYETSLQKMAAI